MSLHIEYECMYKFFLFVLLVLEAVYLDDPFGFSLCTFLFRSKFFLFVLLVLEAVYLDDLFGFSLSLHHSDFN